MQKRPSGIYTLAYHESDTPDNKHLDKSQNQALKEGFLFADHEEYLLITAYNRFTKGNFMDTYPKVTHTSSRWFDGYLVYGCWLSDHSKLCLSHGDVNCPDPNDGPRELFL